VVVVEVGLVVWRVIEGVEVVGGGLEVVEDTVGMVVLLGVDRFEGEDEVVIIELETTGVVVELVDPDVIEVLEGVATPMEEDKGTLAKLELEVEVMLLTTELELEPPAGARLLYRDNLDDPPHYSQLAPIIFYFRISLTSSLASPKHVKPQVFPLVLTTLPAASEFPQ
jgi:hypothetical protein